MRKCNEHYKFRTLSSLLQDIFELSIIMCYAYRAVSEKIPTCSCQNASSPNVTLTCSAIYADSTYDPISAVFTWCVNGSCTTPTTPQKTSSTDGYAWISTSTFTTTYNISSTYQCGLKFSQPTDIQDPSLATNAPNFNHTVSCFC